MIEPQKSPYRWYILALGTATHILAFAMPRMCMPVLFKEISDELGLDLVQVGTVWGMIGLAGLATAFAYGLAGDRYGTRLTLGVACLMLGIAGALRGLANSFIELTIFMFLFGLFSSPISFTTHKAAGQWFSGKQLGLANGILAMGMGVGFALGSMVSATVLSPLLGSWRNIMFLYGGITVLISLLWFQSKRGPGAVTAAGGEVTVTYRQSLTHVVRLKAIWIIGITHMCITGTRAGLNGYLPLFLRDSGWAPVSADGALSLLAAMSVIGVLPLSILSDKLGLRKAIIIPAIIMMVAGTGLLAVFSDATVWVLVALVGLAQEGLAAGLITMVMETEGIGATYAGAALGMLTTFAHLGNFFSPPAGNRLAVINPSLAWIFWASLGLVALVAFHFTKETGWRKKGLSDDKNLVTV